MKKSEIRTMLIKALGEINWFIKGDKLVDFYEDHEVITAYVLSRHTMYEFTFEPNGLVSHWMLINGIESTIYTDYSETIDRYFEGLK